ARPLLFQANTGGIAARVSTLLITVGFPQSLDSAGSGGFVRGEARRPSSDASSACSSPRTKPRGPRRISTWKEHAEPSKRSPFTTKYLGAAKALRHASHSVAAALSSSDPDALSSLMTSSGV